MFPWVISVFHQIPYYQEITSAGHSTNIFISYLCCLCFNKVSTQLICHIRTYFEAHSYYTIILYYQGSFTGCAFDSFPHISLPVCLRMCLHSIGLFISAWKKKFPFPCHIGEYRVRLVFSMTLGT